MSVVSLRCCCCPERGPSISSLICCGCSQKPSLHQKSSNAAIRLSQQIQYSKPRTESTSTCGLCSESRMQHNDHVELHNVLGNSSIPSSSPMPEPMVDMIRQIRVSLEQREEKQMKVTETKKAQDHMAMQWKETAQILDRFLFMLYLILMAASLSIFFPKPYTD